MFAQYFMIKKSSGQFYTWHDSEYKKFMLMIFEHLVPRCESEGTIIQDEFDEINELLFFNSGKIGIGFSFNSEYNFCIFKQDNCVIGSEGLMLDIRSEFVYKAVTDVKGFTLSKQSYHEIQQSNPVVVQDMKKKVLGNYFRSIKYHILKAKQREEEKFIGRRDF